MELADRARPGRRRGRRPHHAGPAARALRRDGRVPGDPRGDASSRPARPATWPPSCAACSTWAPCSTRAATSRRRARPTPAPSSVAARWVGRGRRYALEARVLGIQAAYVLGDWDGAAAMADLSHDAAAGPGRGDGPGQRHGGAAGRGDLSALDLLPSLRAALAARGHGGAVRRLRGDRPARRPRRPDGREPRRTTTCVVERRRHVGQQDFQARIRLAALVLGHVADAAASTGSQDRAGLVDQAGRAARGRPAGGAAARGVGLGRGPGGAGLAGPGATPSTCGCAGWPGSEAPELDDLVEAWRRTVARFETFGHRFEVARSQARLAAVLRAGGQPAEADAVAALAHDRGPAAAGRPAAARAALRRGSRRAGPTRPCPARAGTRR